MSRHRAPMVEGGLHLALLGLARLIVARPKTVLAVWAVLVAISTPFALNLSTVLTQQGASKTVPGTASAAVAEDVARDFPRRSERETVVVVSAPDVGSRPIRQLLAVLDAALELQKREGKVLDSRSAYTVHRQVVTAYVEAQLAVAGADRPALSRPDAVALVERLLASQPRLHPGLAALARSSAGLDAHARTALASDFTLATDWSRFPLKVPTGDVVAQRGDATLVVVSFPPGGADPDIASLRETVGSVVRALHMERDVSYHVTGEIPLLQDTYQLAEAENAKMAWVAYAVIGAVLLIFFRAVLPTVLTVAMIGLAMNVSQAWLYILGHQVHLTQFTSTIMTFVMLGAGIDYSMLLSSRYRQERLAGRSAEDAVVHATARSGESVMLAGAAVVIAFGATLLSPIDWIPPLGYGGLVGIPIILAAALTLTPALLALLGDRFFLLGYRPLADMEARGALSAVLRRVVGVSKWCPALVVTAFALATVPAVMTIGSHALSADPVALSPATQSRRGAELVTEGWGESTLFPTLVTGRLREGLRDAKGLTPTGEASLDRLVRSLAGIDGVTDVRSVTRPLGAAAPRVAPTALPPDVRRDYLSDNGTVRITVQLRGDPFSSHARATVDEVAATVKNSDLGSLLVGGATRVDSEYEAALVRSFWQMIAVVSAALMILLLFAMRSLLVPLRLIATIMLSNVWAIALTVLVFQVWSGDPVINDLPVFLVILMMGLGMDYEIFLITRVRDLVRQGASDADATSAAVIDTGRVITAAGLVMAGSLGTMMLSSTLMLKQYGFGLGAAVLLDATLVRMFLVPASLLLFRKYNWWLPAWPMRRTAQS